MGTVSDIITTGFGVRELLMMIFGLGLMAAGFMSLRKGRTVTGPRICFRKEQPVAFWFSVIVAYWGIGAICVFWSVIYSIQKAGYLTW